MFKIMLLAACIALPFACSDESKKTLPYLDAGAADVALGDSGSCAGVSCSGQGTCSVGKAGPACQCNPGHQAYGLACIKLSQGPVAWWRMDEPAGAKSAADASGNGHDGVINAVKTGVNGVLGQAFSFKDGLVTVMPSAKLDKLSSLSISMWLKPAALPKGPPSGKDFFFIVTRREPPPDGVDTWRVAIGAGSLAFSAEDESGDQHGTTPRTALNIDKWNHLVATFSSMTISLYLDGKRVSSVAAKRPLKVDTPAKIYLGNNLTLQRGFEGLLDEVRIFDVALTDAEVKAEYDALCPAGACNP